MGELCTELLVGLQFEILLICFDVFRFFAFTQYPAKNA
jgi:hypothetical protein